MINRFAQKTILQSLRKLGYTISDLVLYEPQYVGVASYVLRIMNGDRFIYIKRNIDKKYTIEQVKDELYEAIKHDFEWLESVKKKHLPKRPFIEFQLGSRAGFVIKKNFFHSTELMSLAYDVHFEHEHIESFLNTLEDIDLSSLFKTTEQ